MNRRKFLRDGTLTAAGAGLMTALPLELIAGMKRNFSAADTVNIGLIGCKGMGWSDLTSMLKIPGVKCMALCDIDQNVLDQRRSELDKIGIKPLIYTDYRKLLENKTIDVVIIATPDHWHCLQMIDAVAAGKDVYVEKPAANSIFEAGQMVAQANNYNRIVQVNQWQRSQQHFKNAIEFVQSGKLGKINMTKTWMFRGGTKPLMPVANEPIPAGVNYDMWLGPAEKRPFNRNRFHYEFRWFWDYAGGLMTDWGVHLIDMVLLGMKADTPKSVIAMGGKYEFPNDARETPDLQTVVYDYGDFQMIWEHTMAMGKGNYGMQHGIAFLGENGILLLNREGWEVRPEVEDKKDKMEAVAWQPKTDNGLDLHTVNFIDAVRSRKKEMLNCPIEAGARVAVNAHMGNIAYRVGEKINWEKNKNVFDNTKATKLVKPEYHNGWKLPQD
jgi:predicted dehydrogenase